MRKQEHQILEQGNGVALGYRQGLSSTCRGGETLHFDKGKLTDKEREMVALCFRANDSYSACRAGKYMIEEGITFTEAYTRVLKERKEAEERSEAYKAGKISWDEYIAPTKAYLESINYPTEHLRPPVEKSPTKGSWLQGRWVK